MTNGQTMAIVMKRFRILADSKVIMCHMNRVLHIKQ